MTKKRAITQSFFSSKRDLWRYLGFFTVFAGQFFPKHPIAFGYGESSFSWESNEVTIMGLAIAVVIPIISRYLDYRKGTQ